MGCYRLFLLVLLVAMGVPLAVSEQSDPTLEEAISTAKAQGFEANNLFAYLTEDCSLPCWNNITVGETSEEVFLEHMGELRFNSGPYLFESEEYDKDWRFVNQVFIPAEGDDWQFAFAVYGRFNEDTLQILQLNWQNYGMNEMLPNVVIEQLGTPDEVYVAYDADTGGLLWLKYEQLHTDFIYNAFAERRTPPPFKICPDVPRWIDSNSGLLTFISSPAYPEIRLQNIQGVIDGLHFRIYNITEVSSYTAESFANAVVNNSETCLTLDEAFVTGLDR